MSGASFDSINKKKGAKILIQGHSQNRLVKRFEWFASPVLSQLSPVDDMTTHAHTKPVTAHKFTNKKKRKRGEKPDQTHKTKVLGFVYTLLWRVVVPNIFLRRMKILCAIAANRMKGLKNGFWFIFYPNNWLLRVDNEREHYKNSDG